MCSVFRGRGCKVQDGGAAIHDAAYRQGATAVTGPVRVTGTFICYLFVIVIVIARASVLGFRFVFRVLCFVFCVLYRLRRMSEL